MTWKPLAWFCIAFVIFVIVSGPAFLGAIEENRQLQYTVAELQKQLDQSNQQLTASEGEAQARRQLERELSTARTQLEDLQTQLSALHEQHDYQREMQANLDRATAQIDQLEVAAREAEGQQEVELRKRIAALRTHHEQTESSLDAFVTATDPADRETTRTRVSDGWSELSSLLSSNAPELADLTP